MNNIIEINDITAPELDIYARTSEVQLLRYYEPDPGIFIAESPKVIERALNADYEPISFLVEHKDLEGEAKYILERYPEIPVYTAEYEVLVGMTGYALARGMLCANETPSASVCRRDMQKHQPHCNSGKCRESDKYRGNFPKRSGSPYGCCSSDKRMQRSTLSKSGPGEHGNRISDPMDIF